jgi:hypothetical protein
MPRRSKSPEVNLEEIAKRVVPELYVGLEAVRAEVHASARCAAGYPVTINERLDGIEDRLKKLEIRIARLGG